MFFLAILFVLISFYEIFPSLLYWLIFFSIFIYESDFPMNFSLFVVSNLWFFMYFLYVYEYSLFALFKVHRRQYSILFACFILFCFNKLLLFNDPFLRKVISNFPVFVL